MNQGRRRLVHDLGLHGMRFGNLGMRIPVRDTISSGRVGAIEELHHAHAFLEELAGENTVLGILTLKFGSGIRSVFLVD